MLDSIPLRFQIMKISHTLCGTISAAILLSVTASCSKSNQWNLSGNVKDAPENTTLIVEASQNGRWYPLDTIKTDANGDFKVDREAAAHPSIYRLRMADKVIYFPIDSIDAIAINTTMTAFDTDFHLSGTPEAEMMEAVDKRLMDAASKRSAQDVVSDSLLKRELGRKLLANPSGIVAYYIINKQIDGRQLFNPSDKFDNRIIGAVANAYADSRPNDPRTEYLRKLYISGRPAAVRNIEAAEVPMFDIRLFDRKGQEQSLTETAKAHKVVVLNFTTYSAPESTPFNNELHKIWKQHESQGLAIYQVSVSDEEPFWRSAAANLPWISVYQSATADATPILNYNVAVLPTTYIIANGEIKERLEDITRLNTAVSKYL